MALRSNGLPTRWKRVCGCTTVALARAIKSSCSCMATLRRPMNGVASSRSSGGRAGVRVVVPDYRGAGGSAKPPGGYDKQTMDGDVHALLYKHLGLTNPVTMVGHDIGMMVAYAFARRFPD